MAEDWEADLCFFFLDLGVSSGKGSSDLALDFLDFESWLDDGTISGAGDCGLTISACSDLCFFDFDFSLSSPSRFRFFSPCEDLSFLEDLDRCFSVLLSAADDCKGISIDMLCELELDLTSRDLNFFNF